MTNTVKYLADVTITVDKQYSRSYGNATDYHYDFAIIDGDWIELYDSFVSHGRKKLSAKHFHSYAGTEITERTFKIRKNKARKIWQEKRDAEKDEAERKQAEYNEYVMSLKNELQSRIIEVMPKIAEIVTLKEIDARLNKDMASNEICNRAVGIVGYQYAKHLGWMNVLSQIKENYVKK